MVIYSGTQLGKHLPDNRKYILS